MRESIVGDRPAVTVQDHSSLPLTSDFMHDAHLSAADRYKPTERLGDHLPSPEESAELRKAFQTDTSGPILVFERLTMV